MQKINKKILLWFLDLGINIIIIVILVFVIQKWIIAPFVVDGASMCDTLNNINSECVNNAGERIIINEAGYIFTEPKRGDIVVFKPNIEQDKYYIKRIIGLPGETVEIKNGEIFIKTTDKKTYKLEENYLNGINKGNTMPYFSSLTVFEVPEDRYFLLGDNRRESTDSRSCFFGNFLESCVNNPEQAFISKDLIRGKAWFVWWPLSNIRMLGKETYSLQEISESLEEK